MAFSIKNLLPGLMLLVLLPSCSTLAPNPSPRTATEEPPLATELQYGATQTPVVTQDQVTQKLELSTPKASETSCQKVEWELQSYQIAREDEILAGKFYTPPCYLESGLSYPTLSLLHGATETEQQWEDLGRRGLVDGLLIREVIPPLLIVMPREDSWVYVRKNPFGDGVIQGVIP